AVRGSAVVGEGAQAFVFTHVGSVAVWVGYGSWVGRCPNGADAQPQARQTPPLTESPPNGRFERAPLADRFGEPADGLGRSPPNGSCSLRRWKLFRRLSDTPPCPSR